MSDKGLPSLLERHWAESALAIGAIVIAAVSLWVAYDTERTNRELVDSQRQLVAANSWPFVQWGESDGTPAGGLGTGVTLLIMNSGIGPAKLETLEVFWKGRAQGGPGALLRDCCNGVGNSGDHPVNLQWIMDNAQVSSTSGRVLRPGQSIDFLILPRGSASAANWHALHSALFGGFSLRYCYCSEFDACWLVQDYFGKQRSLNPPQVAVCPQPKVPYSSND